jgi:hypothetical protein
MIVAWMITLVHIFVSMHPNKKTKYNGTHEHGILRISYDKTCNSREELRGTTIAQSSYYSYKLHPACGQVNCSTRRCNECILRNRFANMCPTVNSVDLLHCEIDNVVSRIERNKNEKKARITASRIARVGTNRARIARQSTVDTITNLSELSTSGYESTSSFEELPPKYTDVLSKYTDELPSYANYMNG